jgi:uncharacterized protein DUF3489
MREPCAEKDTHMTTAETTDKAATVAAQGAHVAPENATSKKAATRKKGAPVAKQPAKKGKEKADAPKKTGKPKRKAARREESKGAKILEMVARAKGATLAEIMKATGWQAHSVRGFISTAGKNHGLAIESAKNDAGDRVYRMTK